MSMIPCSSIVPATNFWCLVLDIVHRLNGFGLCGLNIAFRWDLGIITYWQAPKISDGQRAALIQE